MKTIGFSLQERDLELEMGDDYILDLQSKGSSVVVVLRCYVCEKYESTLVGTSCPAFC